MNERSRAYRGPALLSCGFRPFFLLASLFALVAVPAWLLLWEGRATLGGPFLPADWHVHEMVWGYAAAVVAGFLFTAIPNWTGRMPARGLPLAALAAVWLAGRLACAGLLGLPPFGVAAVDGAFLAAVAAMATREIVAGRNWRNLMVLLPVAVLWLANLLFHGEVAAQGVADVGRRLGVAMLVLLVTLIGGRIVPSFTRNWLARRGAARMPAPAGRFDALCLLAGAGALLLWSLWPGRVAGGALVAAGLLHAARLARWRGVAAARDALLLMLHLAYGFVPLGLVVTGLAQWGLLPAAAGVHLLAVGGIGGMTLAVMMRATLGHTGRELRAGPWLAAAFGLVALAALARTAAEGGLPGGMTAAGALWAAAFALFAFRVGPWLWRPQAAARRPVP